MNNRISLSLVFLPVGLFVVLFGCTSDHPAGMPALHPCVVTVMQDGVPLADATIIFHTGSWAPMGVTDAQGKAVMRTQARHDGAAAGKYKVTVAKTEREPSKLGPAPSEEDPAYDAWSKKVSEEVLQEFSLIETAFSNPQTTPLEIEVVKGKNAHTVDVGKAVRAKID